MQVRLRVLEGSHAGKEIAVRGSKFLIGRSDDCNLRPNSDAISRRHCIIIVSGDVVGIRDLKSRNGTLVNGKKITGDKRLRQGDRLRVGPLEFEVVLKTAEHAPKPSKREAAAGAGSGSGEGPMGGMVSQWLEEADEFAREEQRLAAPETREYRIDETSRIALEAAAEAGTKPAKKSKEDGSGNNSQEEKSKKADKEKASKPGKPKFAVKGDDPKDTQEAAAQVLRKLFNRG